MNKQQAKHFLNKELKRKSDERGFLPVQSQKDFSDVEISKVKLKEVKVKFKKPKKAKKK